MQEAYRFYIHDFQLSWELIGPFSFDTSDSFRFKAARGNY